MPANVDALVKEGIALFKGGKRTEAKQALMKAVEINQQNEQAWLWLSALVDTPDERLLCLENVLDLNPNNAAAKKGLEETKREIAARGSAQKPAPAADPYADFGGFGDASPFAGTGFDANPYGGSSQTSDPALSGWSGFDVSSSSVDWGQPAPPSAPVKGEPTAADYDSWMAGLSINPGGSSGSSFDSGFGATSDPFGNPPQVADSGFGTGDPFGGSSDAFGGSNDGFGGSGNAFGDFSFGNADFGTGSTTPAFSPDSFDDSFNAYDAPAAAPAQSTSAFGDFSFEEPLPADTFGATSDDPFNLNKPGGNKSQFDFGTNDFFNAAAVSEPLTAPDTLPVTQDDFNTVDDFPAPSFNDDIPAVSAASDFDLTDAVSSFDDSEPVPVKADSRIGDSFGASIFTTIDSTPSLANPSVYFQQIPEEIQVAGTARALKQKVAAPVITSNLDTRLVVMVVVLLVLNLGSLLFLLLNLGR